MEARIDRLERLMQAHARDGETQMAQCDICHHVSDADLTECPFCGDGSGVEGDEEQEEEDNKIVHITKHEAIQLARPDKYTEKDLDEALEGIRKSSKLAATEIYKMGKALLHIRENGLWKLRKNRAGGQLFLGFQDCVTAELGIKQSWTSRIIRIAEHFTPEQIDEHGVTRLSVSLRLEPEKREKFFVATKELSARGPELAAMADKIKTEGKSIPRTVVPNKNPVTATGHPMKPKREPPSRLTYDVPLGQRILPMYKRPTVPGPMDKPTTPAKSLTDDPWLTVEIAQDLFLSVRLRRNAEGDMQAIVDLKHSEKEVG
jgi:hypothetical protein